LGCLKSGGGNGLNVGGGGRGIQETEDEDGQESTEGSKQACVRELHNGCGTDTHGSWLTLHSSFFAPRSSIHALPPNSCLILRSTIQ
jgi:hypothetical protein